MTFSTRIACVATLWRLQLGLLASCLHVVACAPASLIDESSGDATDDDSKTAGTSDSSSGGASSASSLTADASGDESADQTGDGSSVSDLSTSQEENSTTSEDSSTSDQDTSDTSDGKIALVQYNADVHFGDVATIRQQLRKFADEAAKAGATMIVFPEGSSLGYASQTEVWCGPGQDMFSQFKCRDVSEVAQDVETGEATMYWSEFAEANNLYVVHWLIERDGDAFYNALAVVGPQGFVTSYRKRSLYYIDEAYATPGTAPSSFETPWGKYGLLICLDGNASDSYYTEYLDDGATGIILSMDWDQAPEFYGPASITFRERADRHQIEIFASDVSPWDGTGRYLPGDVARERDGLPEPAVDMDGISYHVVPAR